VKNQYFGDVNDYRKYGLLRALIRQGGVHVAVCWMLTPDDGHSDGRVVRYLEQTKRWRHFDPELYDWLRHCVVDEGARDVCRMEQANLLPGATFYAPILPDDAAGRSRYFERFWLKAEGCHLVFFDPDNGMEVKSRPYGRKRSSKFLYWRELAAAWRRGHSLLVYQHFRRERRDAFIARMAGEMCERLGARQAYSLRTAHVVFLLVAQEEHSENLEPGITAVRDAWYGQTAVAEWSR
jgi:hypothetical protein